MSDPAPKAKVSALAIASSGSQAEMDGFHLPPSRTYKRFPAGNGLKPCRERRPGGFAREADAVLESIEGLVNEIRTCPVQFPDTGAIVRHSGFGTTRISDLFRQHYHATPADLLSRARLDASKSHLLTSGAPLVQTARAVGFGSVRDFQERFLQSNGMTRRARTRSSERLKRSSSSCPPVIPSITCAGPWVGINTASPSDLKIMSIPPQFGWGRSLTC
jgi:methylphosphotriester-DNA--protein-cysteine methyltransferase